MVAGELVVRFKDGVSPDEQQAFMEQRGLLVTRRHFSKEYVSVSVPSGSEEALREELSKNPAIASAEGIPLMFLEDLPEPNDPVFYAQRWNFDLMQVREAWTKTQGAGVIVAVIDTGVAFEDYTDPATQQKFLRGPDFTSAGFVYPQNLFKDDAHPSSSEHPNDDNGHGTHVASVIGESTNNGLEAAGVAYEALIMPVKACGLVTDSGPTPTPPATPAQPVYGCRQDDVADAIDWAVTHGADVINISAGSVGQSASIQVEAVNRALGAGILVVAASGNGGLDKVGDPNLNYPAALPGVIAVGAAGTTGARAPYSNYGSSPEDPERTLDVVAPGGDANESSWVVQNTFTDFCAGNRPPVPIDYMKFASCGVRGTSQAAAHVSAIAALILSLDPNLAGDEVRELLQCSARDVGEPGPDAEHGYGLVQAFDAIRDSDGDGVFDCLDRPDDACGVLAASPIPTPAPSAPGIIALGMTTPLPTPSPTPTIPPSETPTPVQTPTPTGTPAETVTPVETSTATPTATATPTSTPPSTPTTPPGAVACGDVDCDYDVDAVDALWVLRHVAQNGAAACMDKGYTNCDQFISAVDALYILRYVAALPLAGGDGCPVIGYSP